MTVTTTMESTTTRPHVLVVGLAAVDCVAQVDQFPKPDDKIRSKELFIEGGGNAANTACAMGRLSQNNTNNDNDNDDSYMFCDCSIVTAVGDDANGNTIIDGLMGKNVNVDNIERFSGSSPFTYILCANIENGDNTRTCIHQPTTGTLSIDFVNQIPLGENNITAVHFDVRYPEAAVALAERCVDENIPYSVDVERPREGLLELLQNASIVIFNSTYCDKILESEIIESEQTMEEEYKIAAAKMKKVLQMQAPKAKLAVQTLGGKGCCLISTSNDQIGNDDIILLQDKENPSIPTVSQNNGVLYCKAFGGCNVVDTTGAGDAFQGGFLAALWSYMARKQQGKDLSVVSSVALGHALRIASRVAAKKIEQPGARRGLPLGATDEFIKAEFKAMVSK